jgi:hypothetical protein
MIDEIREIEINGKKYEITKRGCSVAMGIQGLFTLLITRARIDLGRDIPVEKIVELVSVSLTDDNIARIKEKVIQCVTAPKITNESFEEMDFSIPSQLFGEIYDFHCGTPDKKKETPEESAAVLKK